MSENGAFEQMRINLDGLEDEGHYHIFADSCRKMFHSLTEAGFNDEQAMTLLIQALQASLMQQALGRG